MEKTVSLTPPELDVIIQSLYHLKDTLKDLSDLDDDKMSVLSSAYKKLVNA